MKIIKPIFLVLLALLSLWLHFGHWELLEFKLDEFEAFTMAWETIHLKPLLIGLVSSNQLMNPPGFIYLMAIPQFFNQSIAFSHLYIMMLNAIAIFGLYYLLSKYGSKTMAFLICLLFYSAPWFVLYSRKIWPPDLVFPLVMVSYFLFYKYLQTKKQGLWYLYIFSVAVLSQLQITTWFVLPAFIIGGMVLSGNLRWKTMLFSLLIGLSTYLPYMVYHFQDNFENISLFLKVRNDHQIPHYSFGNVWESIKIHSGFGMDYALGTKGFLQFQQQYKIPKYLEMSVLIAFISLVLFSIFMGIKGLVGEKGGIAKKWKPEKKLLVLVLVVFACGHIGLYLSKTKILPHYNNIFYPIIPFLLAYGVSFLKNPHGQTAFRAVVVLVVCLNLLYCSLFFQFIAKNGTSIDGDYGQPLGLRKKEWLQKINDYKGHKKAP